MSSPPPSQGDITFSILDLVAADARARLLRLQDGTNELVVQIRQTHDRLEQVRKELTARLDALRPPAGAP